MEQINILEVGACSILDFDHSKVEDLNLNITKVYNKHIPNYSNESIQLKDIDLEKAINSNAVVICSIGSKGERKDIQDLADDEYNELVDKNITIPMDLFRKCTRSYLKKSYSGKDTTYNIRPFLFIYFDSVCSEFENTYDKHNLYAVAKIAMKKMLYEYAHSSSNNKIHIVDLILGQTTSRMCKEGQSPDIVRSVVVDLIRRFKNNPSKLNKYTVIELNTAPYK